MYKLLIKNARIIRPSGIIDGNILIEDGYISDIGDFTMSDDTCNVLDVQGRYVSHGFIDLHTHGAGGSDFMDCNPKDFCTIAKTHLSHGTTLLYPTTVASDMDTIIAVVNVLKQTGAVEGGSRFGGLHIEGPYCAQNQSGALDKEMLKNPDYSEYSRIFELSDYIHRWTIAPELPGGLKMIHDLMDNDIIPSIGHSDATYSQTVQAYNAGCRHVTHLYSCMAQGIRRDNGYRIGGVVEAAYLLDGMTVEIIADGSHLPEELLNMVMMIKGSGKTALITDSMRAAGTTAESSILGNRDTGLEVIIEDNVAKLLDRSAFAGSVATADMLIRTMIKHTKAPLYDIVTMLTKTPAEIAGIDDTYGILDVGRAADLAIFDDDIDVFATIVDGKIYYS